MLQCECMTGRGSSLRVEVCVGRVTERPKASLAWWLTGSVGLLSDALESFVNLAAALMALWMVIIAERPPDEDHAFGHSKAEYFSSAVEGALILLAFTGVEALFADLGAFSKRAIQISWLGYCLPCLLLAYVSKICGIISKIY